MTSVNGFEVSQTDLQGITAGYDAETTAMRSMLGATPGAFGVTVTSDDKLTTAFFDLPGLCQSISATSPERGGGG